MKQYKDPKPEILRIEELVNGVKSGDIKLPKFQRPFVWKKPDILKIWDSIYKGYPIGSILLWLTHQKLASERKIGDLIINEREEEYPSNYLLDGQQRLSSLCGALYWAGEDNNSPWNIVFDVDKEMFLYPQPGEEDKVQYYPLNKLIETKDFLAQMRKFESSPQKDKYMNNAERLLKAIKDYKIAAVKIGDMDLNEVAPIFERINSTGRQLTIVDLMRAATWKGGFDLSDAIDMIKAACEEKNFKDIKDSHILRSIAGCAGLGIHKEDIDKLRDCTPEQLKMAADRSVQSYRLAVDFITSELPLPSIEYLPYGLQLSYLVEFFNVNPKPNVHQRHHLREWFWKTSFTQYYGSSNTGLITKDLAQIRAYAKNDIKQLGIEDNINFQNFLMDTFALNKASSKVYALLLATQNPKSLLDGAAIDIYRALAITNNMEYHHIFPKKFLETQGYSKEKINYHANICMLNLSNNREISNKRPSDYFPKLKDALGSKFESVLQSNFINEQAFQAGLKNDYETFIKERSKLLQNAITDLVGKEFVS